MRHFNKIFVIALPRCASVSLSEALGILGVPTAHLGRIYGGSDGEHHDLVRLQRIYDQMTRNDFDFDVLRECRGLADYPVCCLDVIQEVDRQYPGSLFINAHRGQSADRWLRSVEQHFIGLQLLKLGATASPSEQAFMRLMLKFRAMTFGTARFDVERYRDAYDRFQRDVQDYFQARGSDLLHLGDVSELEDTGFDRLSSFLEMPNPELTFPRNDAHSVLPRQAFMHALNAGEIESQTGIARTVNRNAV